MTTSPEDPTLRPPEYRITASWDGDGELCDSQDNVLLHFRSVQRRPSQFGGVRTFEVLDVNGREVASFVCRKRFPRGFFEITRSGQRIGEVRQLTLLFTRYSVRFDDGEDFVFRFPHSPCTSAVIRIPALRSIFGCGNTASGSRASTQASLVGLGGILRRWARLLPSEPLPTLSPIGPARCATAWMN